MRILIEEFQRITGEQYTLRFVYPTAEERRSLRIVHRNIDRATSRVISEAEDRIGEVARLIEEGEIFPEDFDEETHARLRDILGL